MEALESGDGVHQAVSHKERQHVGAENALQATRQQSLFHGISGALQAPSGNEPTTEGSWREGPGLRVGNHGGEGSSSLLPVDA